MVLASIASREFGRPANAAEGTVAERPDAYRPHPLKSAFPLGSEIICSEEPELSLILHLDYAAVRVA